MTPNTTEPDVSRVFTTPAGEGPVRLLTYATGGEYASPVAEFVIWGKDPAFDEWMPVGTYWSYPIPAYGSYVFYPDTTQLPRNLDCFVQITTVYDPGGKIGIAYVTDVA